MRSILQSKEWQEFQEAIGRKTFTSGGDGWSYLAILEKGTLNTRLYTPHGPSYTNETQFIEAIDSLRTLARSQRATFIRIDPEQGISVETFKELGLTPVNYQQLQPSHTQVINLMLPEDEILSQMSQNSRNITRNYRNKGITIRESHDSSEISILTSLLSKVAQRNHISAHSENYFTKQADVLFPSRSATLYIAEYEGKPIAASLALDGESTRIYAHAAADDAYRRLGAGTAIVGQMILDAKRKGLQEFDLYGIADSDDPSHPWAGFTRFKKSFGGSPVSRLGTWDLPINKLGYCLYRLYQAVYRRIR